MDKNFLNNTGLSYFFEKLKQLFASHSDVNAVRAETDNYVTQINYSDIQFDTNELIK